MIFVETADPVGLQLILTNIDTEFIFGKGRNISLEKRFPRVYSNENYKNIYLMRDKDDLYATVTVKKFLYQINNEIMNGAMIGMVYTNPACRGKGYATQLMDYVVKELEKDTDFAILWTRIHPFYEKAGWKRYDIGIFGRVNTELLSHSHCSTECEITEPEAGFINEIEEFRNAGINSKVIRNVNDYMSIPIPAEKVYLIRATKDSKLKGYSIFGINDTNVFSYEIYGNDESITAMLKAMSKLRKDIFINEDKSSYAYRFLSHYKFISWEDQDLAMWYPLKKNIEQYPSRHIAYFDRI